MFVEFLAALCFASFLFFASRLLLALPALRHWPVRMGSRLLHGLYPPAWRRSIERDLLRAGRGTADEAASIVGWQLLLGGAGCCVGTAMLAGGMPTLLCLLFPIAAALLPILRLRERAKQREAAIGRALPWTLDLLSLAVEVGVDFNVALARVVEMGRRGPWADELARVVREMRVGSSRHEALEALRRRSGHPAVARFCTAVVQADRLGTPLRRVLLAQAVDLRIARCQRAERLAGEAPVKLLMPLLGCIFPTVFLVLLGPIAFSILVGGVAP